MTDIEFASVTSQDMDQMNIGETSVAPVAIRMTTNSIDARITAQTFQKLANIDELVQTPGPMGPRGARGARGASGSSGRNVILVTTDKAIQKRFIAELSASIHAGNVNASMQLLEKMGGRDFRRFARTASRR